LNSAAKLSGDRAPERVAKVDTPVDGDAVRFPEKSHSGKCIRLCTDIGRDSGQSCIAPVFREKHACAGATVEFASPGNKPNCQIGIAMKSENKRALATWQGDRTRGLLKLVTDKVSFESMSIGGPVRNTRGPACGWNRSRRRLEHNTLLVVPEEEQHE
jgi:hypothetical protein